MSTDRVFFSISNFKILFSYIQVGSYVVVRLGSNL